MVQIPYAPVHAIAAPRIQQLVLSLKRKKNGKRSNTPVDENKHVLGRHLGPVALYACS